MTTFTGVCYINDEQRKRLMERWIQDPTPSEETGAGPGGPRLHATTRAMTTFQAEKDWQRWINHVPRDCANQRLRPLRPRYQARNDHFSTECLVIITMEQKRRFCGGSGQTHASNGSGGIRTHASEETSALNQRLRPLGHATLILRN
ncbi:hypothetical protein AVEN_99091-1 [Araneus ventricosus]|uniref:Uncharacterized protein n=1 Tax=Araneus ventricosus TaxID=182803 RepID=A0A4Y2K3X5_ARAVE|nr:hypothetical protein AVEN_99091-1 [Araneus ventricosus]